MLYHPVFLLTLTATSFAAPGVPIPRSPSHQGGRAITVDSYTTYINHAMNRTQQIFGVNPAPSTFNNYAELESTATDHPNAVLIIAYDKWALAEKGMVFAWASDAYSAEITQHRLAGKPLDSSNGQRSLPHLEPRPWHDGSPLGDPPGQQWLPCSPDQPCDMDADCAMFNCESCDAIYPEIGTCYGDLP